MAHFEKVSFCSGGTRYGDTRYDNCIHMCVYIWAYPYINMDTYVHTEISITLSHLSSSPFDERRPLIKTPSPITQSFPVVLLFTDTVPYRTNTVFINRSHTQTLFFPYVVFE